MTSEASEVMEIRYFYALGLSATLPLYLPFGKHFGTIYAKFK